MGGAAPAPDVAAAVPPVAWPLDVVLELPVATASPLAPDDDPAAAAEAPGGTNRRRAIITSRSPMSAM